MRSRSKPWPPRRQAAHRPRSRKKSRSSLTSAAYAARASPTTPRSSRQTRPERKSTAGTRTDRRLGQHAPWLFSLRFRLEIRVNELAVSRQRGGLDQFVIPIDRERLARFIDQRLDEREQVARIESGCGRGDPAREIGDADDLDPIDINGFAAFHALDVAAA